MENNEKIYAVIDTNVLVSAMLNFDSVPGHVVEHALVGRIIPLLSNEIVQEYYQVLARAKFKFNSRDIRQLIEGMSARGLFLEPKQIDEFFADPKDKIFYAVTMKLSGSYLVTGNTRHFPPKACVVTPREMLTILNG